MLLFFKMIYIFWKKKKKSQSSLSVTILGHAVLVHWFYLPPTLMGLSDSLLSSSLDLGRDCLVCKRIRLLKGAKHQIRAPLLFIPFCV